jgi:TrmH family RNA methyltransferase
VPINGIEADRVQTTESFPGAMAVVALQPVALESVLNNGPVIVLDNIKDPGNLGTIIRTADWFGIKNIVLSDSCVDAHNPKVVRSTVGSLFHVTIHETSDILSVVKQFSKNGYAINALALGGKDVALMKQNSKSVYVFGSESHGVRPELLAMASGIYTIPGKGRAESLNVAVAVGLVLQGISQ